MTYGDESRLTAHLVDSLGHRILLNEAVTRFGRAPDCDVLIPDRRASRLHAELRREAGGFTLVDLGSTNGTRLNGQLLNSAARLSDGDVLEIAATFFTFRDPDSTLDETQFPRLVVDDAAGEVWMDRRPIQLSQKQHALLALLWSRRGSVCGKDEIVRAVWPECHGEVYDYQIESLVKRLRAKVEPDHHHPAFIITVRGRGYKLVLPGT
jgi:pSer/pThr/pTyr-binding forkhead associated (FHA) protein